MDHLAEHFSDGFSAAEHWWGDWGFDDDVLKVLEKASLPGNDRHTAVSGSLTAPGSMMDDYYADSLGVDRYVIAPLIILLPWMTNVTYSFACDTESFAEYPFVDFNSSNFGENWGGSLDLPADFFNFNSSLVKTNDNTSAHPPFLLSTDGGGEHEV